MSKVDRLLMGCIYLILGIPLIYVSVKTPEVEDIANFKPKNSSSMNTFLNYPQDSVIAADIGWFQNLICGYEKKNLHSVNPRCSDISKNSQKPDWADNAFRLNRLRMACLIIGIILCTISCFKFIQLIAPESSNLKQKMKKLQKSKKKK